MTGTEKLNVLRIAYAKACKWIRDNPPGDLDQYFAKPNSNEYIDALAAGTKDPNGRAWQSVFITEALKELEK